MRTPAASWTAISTGRIRGTSSPYRATACAACDGPRRPALARATVQEDTRVMTDRNETVRLAIYSGLAGTGRLPSEAELVEETGLSAPELAEAMEELAASRHLVFDGEHEIVLAHPFATRNFAFSVMGEHTLWWGGCAWDGFAIPNLVPDEPSALVATTCPACGTAHSWTVTREGPPEGTQIAHFL